MSIAKGVQFYRPAGISEPTQEGVVALTIVDIAFLRDTVGYFCVTEDAKSNGTYDWMTKH